MAKHYIRVDDIIVTHGFSDTFTTPTDMDICINENGGRQIELLGELNPALVNTDGTHRFRYVEQITEEVVKITEDVTDEVKVEVDTSGVTLDDGVAVSDINVDTKTTATATGYKTIEHSNMIVRYATGEELAEIERQNKIAQINSQIGVIDAEFSKLDYVGIKIATGRATLEEYVTEIARMNELATMKDALEEELKLV